MAKVLIHTGPEINGRCDQIQTVGEVRKVSVHQKIQSYHNDSVGEHHRYRSWEHCYDYFRKSRKEGLTADRDRAALQLAFYLASWGMYRGSSFLLQHAYTVHRGAIDLIAQQRFTALWDADFGQAKQTISFFL